jgi:hypothetical protein
VYVWIISIFVAIIYLFIGKKKSTITNKAETIYRILCIESSVFLLAWIITDSDLYEKVLCAILFLEALFLFTKKISNKKMKN